MRRFVYLLIIGFSFLIIYNLLPSREGLTDAGAILQAAAQQAAATQDIAQAIQGRPSTSGAAQAAAMTQSAQTQASAVADASRLQAAGQTSIAQSIQSLSNNTASGDASIARSIQALADDTLENRGDYQNPLVVSVRTGGGSNCFPPVTCGGVTCARPNCACIGDPPRCGPGGGIPGCPPCCPPCKSGGACPTPVVCGGVGCAQPNCMCSGDPPTCKPGGCAGCAPPPGSDDPLNKHYNNLNAKQSAWEAQCKANAAQIKKNAATLQAFPAKLQAAYAQLQPMAAKINASKQYIQDSSGILGAFIKNQVAAAKAAAAKADGIAFGPFGAIPSAPIPALLKLVDTIIPKGIQMAKRIT